MVCSPGTGRWVYIWAHTHSVFLFLHSILHSFVKFIDSLSCSFVHSFMWHVSLLGNKILGVHCWLTATWTHSTTHWGMSWCACHIAVMLACYRRDYSCMESTKALITGNLSTANECVCCYTLLWRTASHALVVYWIYVACLHVSVFSILIRLLWSLDAGACACVRDLSILGCGTASAH